MNKNGLEIERKFLIEYPDEKALLSKKGCRKAQLAQAYIEGGGRVRKIAENGKTTYIKTVKRHISDLVREETEWEIDESEYNLGLLNRVKGTSVIEKVRYSIPFNGQVLEVDVFPFWSDRAFLEIELKDEAEDYMIPDYIKVIREVTADKRYRNSHLAKNHDFVD